MVSPQVDGIEAMRILARKLRAKAEWDYTDGWYSTDADQARNSAKREFAEDLASLLDETFDFDSSITREDKARHKRWDGGPGFIP